MNLASSQTTLPGSPAEIRLALRQCNRSELSSLYTTNNIANLNSNLETLLEEQPEDPILRLLWAHTQTSNDLLPISFIASSVHEVIQKQNVLIEAPCLTMLVAKPIITSLGDLKEYRIGLLIIGELLSYDPSQLFSSNTDHENFLNLVSNFIENEKILAVERRESKNYFDFISSIEQRLSEQNISKETPTSEHFQTSDKQNSKSSENSSKEDAQTQEKKRPNNNHYSLADGYTLGSPSEDYKESKHVPAEEQTTTRRAEKQAERKNENSTNIIPEAKKRDSNSSTSLTYIIIFLLASGSLYYGKDQLREKANNLFGKNSAIEDKLLISMRSEHKNDPSFHNLPPHYSLPINTNSSLEEINQRLKSISSTNGNQNNTSQKDETAEERAKKYSETEDIEPLGNNIPEEGESIPEASIPEPKPIPIFTSKAQAIQNGTITPEEISGTERKQDIHGVPARLPQNQNKAPVENVDTERFNPPLVFETISATNVLSAPTLFSPSIVRLERLTMVEVSARVGTWLEIRSNAGQVGYILAQDARRSERPNRRNQ